jgi:hypothetical protein
MTVYVGQANSCMKRKHCGSVVRLVRSGGCERHSGGKACDPGTESSDSVRHGLHALGSR